MGVKEAVRFLVKRRLAGDERTIKAIEMMLIRAMSPSEVEKALGVSRANIKGKILQFTTNFGSSTKAAIVFKHALPVVMSIEPIIVDVDRFSFRCRLCNRVSVIGVRNVQPKLNHIDIYHKGLVNDYTEMVLKKLKQALTNGGGSNNV
jgi:hypothetical protein